MKPFFERLGKLKHSTSYKHNESWKAHYITKFFHIHNNYKDKKNKIFKENYAQTEI